MDLWTYTVLFAGVVLTLPFVVIFGGLDVAAHMAGQEIAEKRTARALSGVDESLRELTEGGEDLEKFEKVAQGLEV